MYAFDIKYFTSKFIFTMKTFSISKKSPWVQILMLLVVFGIAMSGKVIGQTLTNYGFSYSTTTYVPITGGTLLGTAFVDDELYVDSSTTGVLGTTTAFSGGGFPIGFNFNLNGTVYDRLAVSTNGWIGLGISSMSPMVNINNASGSGYFWPIISDGFATTQPIPLRNKIVALCTDLQGNTGSSIRIQTIGTAPSRVCVVQWAGYRKYGSSSDTFDFQIRLNEGTDSINFSYGNFIADASNGTPQVGIVTAAGYINRTSSTSWSATSAGSANTDVISLTTTVKPANGASFNWGMPPKVYVSSTVEAPILSNVGPGSSNEPVVRLKVVVSGLSNILRLGALTVNTNGTTSLSEISSLKIFYTDTSPVFSAARQFGSTIYTPTTNNPIIDSIELTSGNNYFWVTYDVAAFAVLGHYIDGAVTSITVGGTIYTPTVTSPPGARLIQSFMSYVSSTSAQPDVSKIQRGSTNNKILRMDVVMSATGSPTNITNFSLSTNGSANVSTNITNAKVWYTGSSSTFVASLQFGSTSVAPSGTFSIAGTQALTNGINYFWVSYDVSATATVGDSVDAELLSFTVGGTTQYPALSAPAGSRQIRAPYCASSATSTGDEEIWGVQFGSMNNVSTCTTTAPGPGSVNQMYSNYTTSVTPPDIPSGIPTFIGITKGTCGGFYGEVIAVYIDYNQDGVFGAGENPFTSSYASGVNNQVISSMITVPCTALSGNTMMRVVYVEGTAAPACGTYTWGETEDYMINIVNGPAQYLSSGGIQVTGVVAPGTNDVPIIRYPVKVTASPCNPGIVTEIRFNTSGTTNVSNIIAAKLYKTGNSAVFNTNNLLGTLYSPSGQMVFMVADTVTNDSNNYWLAYDVSATAPNGNVLDARIDSIQAFGNYYVPGNGNPTGNRVLAAPMTYLGSDLVHPDLSKVEKPSANNRMLRIMVRTSLTGSPINVTQFSLGTGGGGADTINIANAKIWYTGNSKTFSASVQFGSTYFATASTTASWSPYTLSGTQPLTNDTNYFWLTYDIKPGAILGDSVDAEVFGITIGGTYQTPATTAPAGNRKIRAPYCASSAYYTNYDDIGLLTMTQSGITVLNNGTGCTPAQSNVNAIRQYTDFSGLNPANMKQNVPVNFSLCNISGTTFTVGSYVGIFIDYNQNGTFDAGEQAYASTGSTVGSLSGSFTIPCTALTGTTRMRVILQSYNPVTNPCLAANTSYYYGETEDYTINILDNAIAFLSSTALQFTGFTTPGATNVPVLRVPVKALGCGIATVTEMRFNTAGTTSATNIISAKLFKTLNTGFNTSSQVSILYSPSGSMVFTLNDTLSGLEGDTNNYWLTYDISSGASVISNFVDARLDSSQILGAYRIPTISAPAGNIQITVPMTYVSSLASHPDLTKVEQGSMNNQILKVLVNTSATGSGINCTNLALSTNGSSNVSTNIANAKVYYTGSSNTFSMSTQFGSASTAPSGTFSVSGSQALLNGINVFWVTYDLNSAALIGDSIDIEISGITIDGISQTPTSGAPAGNRKIRAPYCVSSATSTGDEEIWGVSFGYLNSISTCTTTAPGPGSVNQMYSNYTGLAPTIVHPGDEVTLAVTIGTCGGFYGEVLAAYIDYNQNGLLTDAGENIFTSTYVSGTNNAIRGGVITIPASALTGTTRLRIVYVEGTAAPACGTYTWGETEDYTIDIQPYVFSAYVWNGTTTTDAQTFANWTPARVLRNPGDKLIFNAGGTVNVTNIPAATVSVIDVSNATAVKASPAVAANLLTATDTLNLGTNCRINTGTLILGLGTDIINAGTLNGTGRVAGTLKRWMKAATTSYNFPMADTGGVNRNVTLNYTTAPTTLGSLTTSFTTGLPGTSGLPVVDAVAAVTADRVGETGVWTITSGGTGGTFTGTFNASGFKGVGNYAQLILMNRATAATAWSLNGTHAATTGSNAAPVLSRTGMSAYGQFGVGGNSSVNPLPVVTLYFNCRNIHGDVQLNWATASETNNKGFMIERSMDGMNFEDLVFVNGKGRSTGITQYSKLDESAFARTGNSILYYRLRQEDFGGNTALSNILTVYQNDVLGDEVSVYPNPFNNKLFVEVNSNETLDIKIFDIQGKLVGRQQINKMGLNEINLSSDLKAGIYFMQLNGKQAVKLIKQ